MVPRMIGLPVAATPGLGPHDEMLTLGALLLLLVPEPAELEAAAAPPLLLLELLLLPQPASASRAAPRITASLSRPRRRLSSLLMCPPRIAVSRTSADIIVVSEIVCNLECRARTSPQRPGTVVRVDRDRPQQRRDPGARGRPPARADRDRPLATQRAADRK